MIIYRRIVNHSILYKDDSLLIVINFEVMKNYIFFFEYVNEEIERTDDKK